MQTVCSLQCLAEFAAFFSHTSHGKGNIMENILLSSYVLHTITKIKTSINIRMHDLRTKENQYEIVAYSTRV